MCCALLIDVRCVMFIDGWLLFVVRCLLPVVRCMLFVG